MSEDSNTKINQAQDLLSDAFLKLEQVVLEKINKAKVSNDSSVENLNNEINRLQKNLADLGVENETLMQKNNEISKQIKKIKELQQEIFGGIKSDLEKIKFIVGQANQN